MDTNDHNSDEAPVTASIFAGPTPTDQFTTQEHVEASVQGDEQPVGEPVIEPSPAAFVEDVSAPQDHLMNEAEAIEAYEADEAVDLQGSRPENPPTDNDHVEEDITQFPEPTTNTAEIKDASLEAIIEYEADPAPHEVELGGPAEEQPAPIMNPAIEPVVVSEYAPEPISMEIPEEIQATSGFVGEAEVNSNVVQPAADEVVREGDGLAAPDSIIEQAEPLAIPADVQADADMIDQTIENVLNQDDVGNAFVVLGVDVSTEASTSAVSTYDVGSGTVTVAEPAPKAMTPEEMVAQVQAQREAVKPVEAPKPKSKRGFASMTPERRREIAAKGGKAVPKESRYFAQSHTNASEAGKIGGKVMGPRKPKAKPEATPVATEPAVTNGQPGLREAIEAEHTPNETTVAAIQAAEVGDVTKVESTEALMADLEAPEAVPTAPVVETQDETQIAQEAAPSPAETITEGEPEIPEYLRRLAGGGSINI